MNSLRAGCKFTAFILMTFGVYSPWFLAPLMRSEKRKESLRELIMKNWAHSFVRLAGATVKVIGNAPQPPFLLISNHLGYFDIAVLRSVARCVFVAKADVASWFAVGQMIRNMGIIFIDRANRRDIPRAGAEIVKALENGKGVAIFIEGTSGDGQQVLPFKSSFLEFAAARDLPVHYASISYQTKPNDPPASEAVCWWREDSGFARHLFDFFKLRSFDCTVTFGAHPITSHDRKDLTHKLQIAVNEQFVPSN